MLNRLAICTAAILVVAGHSFAQSTAGDAQWRSPGGSTKSLSPAAAPALAQPVAARQAESNVLPNSHGQVWREYDISPYTLRVTGNAAPQQAVVDWILRETGYEAWHGETVAMLSADARTLRAYHTPEMQQTVSEIVSRFVSRQAETQAYNLQVCTLAHPDWRGQAQRLLRPVPVQSEGAEAWLLAKEDAAALITQLSTRSDFRNHGSPRLMVNDGQKAEISLSNARPYLRSLLSPTQPGVPANVGHINEGIRLELHPLLSADGQAIDAMLKCNITQVERLVSVRLEAPASIPAGRQWYNIEVPQVVSCRFHERFHWPKDKVLLVSLGMIPRPSPRAAFKLPLSNDDPRGEALIIIESLRNVLSGTEATGERRAQQFRGRY